MTRRPGQVEGGTGSWLRMLGEGRFLNVTGCGGAQVPLRSACSCRPPGDPSARSARGDRGRPADGRRHAQGAGDRGACGRRGPAVRAGRAGRDVLAGRRRRGRPGGAAPDVVGVAVRDRRRGFEIGRAQVAIDPASATVDLARLRASRRVVRDRRPGGRRSAGPRPVPGRLRAPRQSGLRRLAGGPGHPVERSVARPCSTGSGRRARPRRCRAGGGGGEPAGRARPARRARAAAAHRAARARPAIAAGRSGNIASWSRSSTGSSGSRRSTRRPSCTTRSARTGSPADRRSTGPGRAAAVTPRRPPNRTLSRSSGATASSRRVSAWRAERDGRRALLHGRGRHRQDPAGRGHSPRRAGPRGRCRSPRVATRARARSRTARSPELLRAGLARPMAPRRLAALNETTRADLARLVDLPAALRPATAAPLVAPDAPGARVRLLEAIADGLTALAAGRVPGLVTIDDLHLADEATREAMAYLARRLGGRSLLLVLTWRPRGPRRRW